MWQPLSQRLPQLPLILAGPMLRRTEPHSVTVWVALKQAQQVTLQVYPTAAGTGNPLLTGSRSTVRLGTSLHLVAVTATLTTTEALQPGQIYAYNLFFDDGTDLTSESHLSYFPSKLPTLTLPSDQLNHLKMVHGSCRKPHGGDDDALAILDYLLQQNASQPPTRPQQLFLTGDQIYGDDVADPLLWSLIDASQALLGWEERLPVQVSPPETQWVSPQELTPGKRCHIAEHQGGFTAMLINKEHLAKSHLFSFGEYCTFYLFTWSPVLWGENLPPATVISASPKQTRNWEKESQTLLRFSRTLNQVRRVLANIATYTICDDHDVTDDWYLNRWWCSSVLSKPLGRRTVLHGLLAYALFQAWGNTPEQFEPGKPGGNLLVAVERWVNSAGTDETALTELEQILGIPPLDESTKQPKFRQDGDVLVLERDESQTLKLHYAITFSKHQLIVLDTRTWRGYPAGENHELDPPMLLSPSAFEFQLRQPLENCDRLKKIGQSEIEVTTVIVPTNLVSLHAIDIVQHSDLEKGKVFHSDVGDSWNFHKEAFSLLLSSLFCTSNPDLPIVILTGDIHYSCAVQLNYWATRHFGELSSRTQPFSSVLAQLTSSPLNNCEWKAKLATSQLKSLLPEHPENWAGWHSPPQLIEVQITPQGVRRIPLEITSEPPIVRQLNPIRGNSEIAWKLELKDANSLPDWCYQIKWIKREKAVIAFTNLTYPEPKTNQFLSPFNLMWRNAWMQEGEEIVGHNNLSVVSFHGTPNPQQRTAIQDVYWRSPWRPDQIIYTRYQVPLSVDTLPPFPISYPSDPGKLS